MAVSLHGVRDWLAGGAAAVALVAAWSAESRDVSVADARTLSGAIEAAKPGDRIVLLPGIYRMQKTVVARPGSKASPITVTALSPRTTRLEFNAVELFKVRAPYWIFENLHIRGSAVAHHAFHIVGPAHHVILRHSKLTGFHAAVKANPEHGADPDHITIDGNIFNNETPRDTAEPVTPIDVVGGTGWIIRGNFLADFAKRGGDNISYGAFLKGNGRNGLFERNLVICEWRHTGGYRIGMSFGGGGTFACAGANCPLEHTGGVMRNNIIANCPRAPGVYINRSRGLKIVNNTIWRSFGIQARFADSQAEIVNNIISGAISARADATVVDSANLETGFSFGAEIPGGARHATDFIDRIGTQYSGTFNRRHVDWVIRGIDAIADWFAESFIGRGDSTSGSWFVNARGGNFSLSDGGGIVGEGVPHPAAPSDFCGHARSRAVDLGAIQYDAGRCDVQAWWSVLFGRFE